MARHTSTRTRIIERGMDGCEAFRRLTRMADERRFDLLTAADLLAVVIDAAAEIESLTAQQNAA